VLSAERPAGPKPHHVQSPVTGLTNHEALASRYALLASHFPDIGALVAQAAAMVEAGEHPQVLEVLKRLLPDEARGYQPYWVTLAKARSGAGQLRLAEEALQTAIGLGADPAVRCRSSARRVASAYSSATRLR
jgi:RNA polymerase sigma-70 factor (ECF subfamily)